MEDVGYVRVHETSLHMQMSCHRSQDLGKDPGGGGGGAKPKGRTSRRVPESKPKVPPMRRMYQHMQIGILEIQQHHPPTKM